MRTDFQYKSSDLSDEHTSQFLKITYIKRDYQKWHKLSEVAA